MLRVTAAAISPPEQKLQQIKTYFISKWPFLQFRFRFGPMADIAGIETIKATKAPIFILRWTSPLHYRRFFLVCFGLIGLKSETSGKMKLRPGTKSLTSSDSKPFNNVVVVQKPQLINFNKKPKHA